MRSTIPLRALLVAGGGTIGAAARLGIGLAVPDPGGIPVATLVVNVAGAFLLGVLVARLPSSSRRRLFLGTGALGGFTTYSALTAGTIALWPASPLLGIGYPVASLVLGILAAAAGLRLARPHSRTRTPDAA